jgi:DNA-binding CsgD family transcriptional regulator
LGFTLLNRGEYARGGGWISQAGSLLANDQLECVERGYLLLPLALKALSEGDAERSFGKFEQIGEIANSFKDPDLRTLSRLGKGQALIRLGEIQTGVKCLDEAMAIVDSGILSPIVVGIVYCAVIETCLEIFDLSRAQEWTGALSDWCTSHPHLVPFRGQCLTRRSEIMQMHGEWQEAKHAVEILSKPKGEPAAGSAFYQLGELHRLHGDFIKAEEAYLEANRFGRKPQPGLALLRLAQGRIETAKTSIQQVMNEAKKLKVRSTSLPAYIEIMIAAKDYENARDGVQELVKISNDLNAPLLIAKAAYAEGSLLRSEGNAQKALECLSKAYSIWETLKSPYEIARTRVLIGMASREIGDEEAANMELDTAHRTFSELNAISDINRIKELLRDKKIIKPGGLTKRELEVLQLIANGKTNRNIANELYISERTVERHVSNIFNKLNVSSRSAATAYAYKQQLI